MRGSPATLWSVCKLETKWLFTWMQDCRASIGSLVGHVPVRVVCASLLFVALCSLGLLNAKFVEEADRLWVSSGKKICQWLHQHCPASHLVCRDVSFA